jgi:hypothetical protein
MVARAASGTLAGSTSGSWTSIHKDAASSDFSRFGRHPSGCPTRTTLSRPSRGRTEPSVVRSPQFRDRGGHGRAVGGDYRNVAKGASGRAARDDSLLVQGPHVKREVRGLSGLNCVACVGGPCARLARRDLCARAPSLTSVHDPRVGSGAGDMMFDGVIPLGEALRPLSLSGPSTDWWRAGVCREPAAAICVTRGLARTEEAHAGANASSPSSRSV